MAKDREPIPAPGTPAEEIAHYRAGVGETCLVCDETLWGVATDYHGEIRCHCGTTYQILGSHLKEEWLAENGLKPTDVARRHCNCFPWVPLLRAFWRETKSPAPFGCYLWPDKGPITAEHRTRFYTWVAQNEDRLRPVWDEFFDWEALLARYSVSFVGQGI